MDLILTGEGHFDEQSTFGKLPIQVAQLSHHHKIKTLLFAGKTSISKLSAFPYLKIHQTTPESIELEEAMKYAAKNMQSKLLEVLQTVKKQIH
jgi:glycerate kinase